MQWDDKARVWLVIWFPCVLQDDHLSCDLARFYNLPHRVHQMSNQVGGMVPIVPPSVKVLWLPLRLHVLPLVHPRLSKLHTHMGRGRCCHRECCHVVLFASSAPLLVACHHRLSFFLRDLLARVWCETSGSATHEHTVPSAFGFIRGGIDVCLHSWWISPSYRTHL